MTSLIFLFIVYLFWVLLWQWARSSSGASASQQARTEIGIEPQLTAATMRTEAPIQYASIRSFRSNASLNGIVEGEDIAFTWDVVNAAKVYFIHDRKSIEVTGMSSCRCRLAASQAVYLKAVSVEGNSVQAHIDVTVIRLPEGLPAIPYPSILLSISIEAAPNPIPNLVSPRLNLMQTASSLSSIMYAPLHDPLQFDSNSQNVSLV